MLVTNSFAFQFSLTLASDEGIEAPEARDRRALVRGQERSAVHLRAVHRLPADLPDVGELILGQQAERLMRDVGELEPDIGRDRAAAAATEQATCVTSDCISTRPPNTLHLSVILPPTPRSMPRIR